MAVISIYVCTLKSKNFSNYSLNKILIYPLTCQLPINLLILNLIHKIFVFLLKKQIEILIHTK